MPATVKQLLPPLYPRKVERVEVTIPDADDLFREVRFENSFVDANGTLLAIKPGAELEVRFEAAAASLVANASEQ